MNPYEVLLKPIISEKATSLRENAKQYVFKIALKANKSDVKNAIQSVYGVKTVNVQTLITRGKIRRRGVQVSLTSKTKKAIVTLTEGAKLPLFEDQ